MNPKIEYLIKPRTMDVLIALMKRPQTARGLSEKLGVQMTNIYRNLRDLGIMELIERDDTVKHQGMKGRDAQVIRTSLVGLGIQFTESGAKCIMRYRDGTVKEEELEL
jgi:predicted ArsR family transcriptional regulator